MEHSPILPASPGGVVCSVETPLKKVIGAVKLTYEGIKTALIEKKLSTFVHWHTSMMTTLQSHLHCHIFSLAYSVCNISRTHIIGRELYNDFVETLQVPSNYFAINVPPSLPYWNWITHTPYVHLSKHKHWKCFKDRWGCDCQGWRRSVLLFVGTGSRWTFFGQWW